MDDPKPAAAPASHSRVWAWLNSPLALLVISSCIIAGGWKLWDAQQDAIKDQEVRRGELAPLLTEYEHRISALGAADVALNDMIGPSSGPARHFDLNDKIATAKFKRLADKTSRAEWDALTGRGSYLPTDPKFANVSVEELAAEIQNLSGVMDDTVQANQLIDLLDAPPPRTWAWVRAQLSPLRRFQTGMVMLYGSGAVPLRRGQAPSAYIEDTLGNVRSQAGLDKLRRENDALTRQLDNDISNQLANATASKAG